MNIHEYISSGIVELYVTGLCTTEEKMEVAQLRLQYPALNEAILRFEQSLEKNMQEQALPTTADTDKKILTVLGALPASAENNQQPAIKRINPMRWMAAAAILLMIISGYFIYTLSEKNYELNEKLSGSGGINATIDQDNIHATLPENDYKIMLDPKITPVAMYGVGDFTACRCTIFWDKKTGKMYMIIHHLPQSSSTKDYQLWAMVNDKPVSVGMIQDDIRGRFIEINNVPADARSFIVTLEKAGGNSSPTLAETYLSGKI